MSNGVVTDFYNGSFGNDVFLAYRDLNAPSSVLAPQMIWDYSSNSVSSSMYDVPIYVRCVEDK